VICSFKVQINRLISYQRVGELFQESVTILCNGYSGFFFIFLPITIVAQCRVWVLVARTLGSWVLILPGPRLIMGSSVRDIIPAASEGLLYSLQMLHICETDISTDSDKNSLR
jgi:hypothetical protein